MIDLSRASPLREAYRGRRVLVIGGTGFLGSVTLSLLLQRLPELERVYLVLRRRPGLSAEKRFYERILPGVPFEPLRARFGEEGLREMLHAKVRVLEGDLGNPMLGVTEEELAELAGGLDLVMNCSGLVDFHAPLERAYRVNILGTRHLIELCERTGAALVHTSTAFVAGHRGGRVPETVEPGSFPRAEEMPYVEFDAEREVADLLEELESIQTATRSQREIARFTEQAIARYRELNDGFPSRAHLENAVRRAARDHAAAEGVEAGRRRAEFWGWPNVYTYSKALGEQLIARSGVRAAIVRPSIIESALAYPVAGWNQNATTSAPLVMLALAGFDLLPGTAEQVIDLIPVDQVAWAIVAVGAATLAERNERVYQVGTSDTNPLSMRRLTDLVGLYTHTREMDAEGSGLGRLWTGNRELRLVSEEQFRRRAALVDSLSKRVLRESARWRDRARHRRLRALLGKAGDRAESIGAETARAVALWDVFLPFSHDLDYRFDSAHIRALAEELAAEDGGAEMPVAFAPREIDWREYWLEVHIPGLRRWVLSDAPAARVTRGISSTAPFADRLESLASRDGYRRALGYAVGGRPFGITYGELWSAAGSIARTLEARGLDPAVSVAVPVDPEAPWPVAVLGVLRAGLEVVLIPGHVAGERLPGVDGVELACALRMVGPRQAQLLSCGKVGAAEEAVEVEGNTGAVRNRSGVSSSPRAGAVVFLTRGEEGWRVARRLEPSLLARELGELGGGLELGEHSRAVLPSAATGEAEAASLALLTLTLLYHGSRNEVVRPDELVEVAEEVSPTTVVLGAGAGVSAAELARLAAISSVDRIVDAAGTSPTGPLRDLQTAELRVGRLEPDAEGARTHLVLLPLAGETERLPVGRGGDGSRERPPPPAVADGLIASFGPADGEAAGQVLVVPDLTRIETLQGLRDRVVSEVFRYNAEADLASRITRVGLALVPRERLARELESDGRVVWISTRRRDTAERDPEEGLRESVRLVGALFDANELDFFVGHLLSEPLERERLLLWERVLLDGVRRGGLPAQVFLQSFDSEWARTRRPAHRAAKRVGGAVEHVRDWLESEDPSGKLLPEPVSAAVRAGIGAATRAFFRYGLQTSVHGAAYVPASENFLVIANHSSHLDAGLVQYALGEWRHRLHTLAAKDYFFSTPGRRFFAHHFTRLIPTDRQRVSSDWLRRARDLLAAGECVLIFPEGTRSAGAEVRPFKASLGTLVRAAGVPVLPIYVEGSEAVLPKGRVIPRGREVRVHIGPPLGAGYIAAATAEVPGLKQDRAIAALLQQAVASVPGGDFWWLRESVEARAELLLPAPSEEEVGG